ncbi:MAG: dihydroorotate dehydrogenase [Chloroflexi bacterium HGW-Chloroflexi-3]|nr:MAG: dihydroorotate dehydrogenase [Chloroflexi bacterium HGW-Chloroflexi-3]
MPDLTTQFLNLTLSNPFVLASGILGSSPELIARCAQNGAGVVTCKSCGVTAREGHANPVAVDWGHGVINAIGLTNPGADEGVHLLQQTKALLAPLGVPLIASIFAPTVSQYGEVAAIISQGEPDLIEVNISCPNVADEFGTPFAGTPESAAAVTEAVKKATTIPISVKLAPNVPNIACIAEAVVSAGADAITAINTMPGMLIDARAGRAVLSNRTGGLSGSAIKLIALHCVAEIATRVNVPIIGTGGVSSGEDAAEMIMAGASAIGIGTAVWYHGAAVFARMRDELLGFMAEQRYPDLAAMRGVALR